MALKELDVSTQEEWREYEWVDPISKQVRIYRIDRPKTVYLRMEADGSRGGTHRIVDMAGVAHCVPSIGLYGCILRWQPKNPKKPVKF